MAKGLEAVKQTVAIVESNGEEREMSRRTYLKKGQSVIARIPEDVVDNLHVFQTVSVFGSILTSLSYHGEGRPERDLYHEAHQIMVADHNAKKASGEIDPTDKEAWGKANALKPKPIFLFGLILLEDFVQGAKKNLYEAGSPILLETNLGKDSANIDALTNFLTDPINAKKFGRKPFKITCVSNNKYSFTSLDEEDLEGLDGGAEMLKVFKETAGQTVPESAFENAIFESTTERQVEDLKSIGFDVTRLNGVAEAVATPTEQATTEVSGDDLPF